MGEDGAKGMTRAVYFCLGCLFTAIGLIGAVTPLLPTTIFLILAAWFFARSSPRLESWLLNHRRFGPTLRNWRAEGAISRPVKTVACSAMAIQFVLFCIFAKPALPVALGVGLILLACGSYVASRPEPVALAGVDKP